MHLKSGFSLHNSQIAAALSNAIQNPSGNPTAITNNLGPLQGLLGNWAGTGFNTIWRPHQPGNDNILQLNVTAEQLTFTAIPGNVPNRGMLQSDIFLFGLTYLQQISDSNTGDGIHVEPGIWVLVPGTTAPGEPQTVARMASIPHGTTMLAQGVATTKSGPPTIPSVDITPFSIGNPANKIPFPSESTLSQASQFRIPSAAQPQTPPLAFQITQGMVNNPNSVLQSALLGQTITSTTTLTISTVAANPPLTNPVGGGTDNIAFLQGAGAPNANAFSVTSTFWLETVSQSSGIFTQLQYSQTVFLNFNGLTWPHVSVATLRLVPVVPCRFASADFVGVYLRLDGSNVSPSSPLGGTVNGQFGAMTWERFSIEPQSDGSSAIASIQFPGVYLALNGTGVNPSHPTGGSVQAAWGVGANSRFFLRDQPDGSIFVESAQFPGVFLFLKAPGVTQSNGPGVGTAGCQAGTASIGNGIRFYFSN